MFDPVMSPPGAPPMDAGPIDPPTAEAPAPTIPEPAVAWEGAMASANLQLADLLGSVTTALENAEECEFCDPKVEKRLKDVLASVTDLEAEMKSIHDEAKVAVEDEADHAEEVQAAMDAAAAGVKKPKG